MTDAWDGRPQNPERDGWHWLRRVGESTRDAPWLWQESLWCHGPDAFNPDDMIDMGWHYLGPCLTPAEVAAAVMAERAACAGVVADSDLIHAGYGAAIARIIRARPAPADGDALAAALAQARREGIEAAAELIEQHSQVCESETVEGQMMQVFRNLTSGEQAAAIRALLPEGGKGDAR